MQTNVKLPPQNQIVDAMLSTLKGKAKGLHVKDIESEVSKTLNLNQEQIKLMHKGKRTMLGYKLAWARTKCKKDGLIISVAPSVWKLVSE
jgi:Mrr N-terminal domain